MAKDFKTIDEAEKAQKEAANLVKEAKTKLTSYYNKNKLNRAEDYADNAKHGPKIKKLQLEIDKQSEYLTQINEQMAKLAPKKAKASKEEKAPKAEKAAKAEKVVKAKATEAKATKYEYPADCDTPEKKKKYRIQMRNANKPAKEKVEKPAKEAKTKKAAKETEAEAPVEKTAKKKAKGTPAKEEAAPAKKKAKKARNDD